MSIFEPYNTPFAVAFVLVLLLALVQAIGLGDMFDGDTVADPSAGAEGGPGLQPGALDGVFTLLGIGRVPLTIWLALFLFGFAAIGVSIQSLAQSLVGAPLNRWVAAIAALVAAIPLTSVLARPLGAILPRDETSAVTTDALLGRRGTITDGIARHGSPARARVQDTHGQTHHVMVEPHEASSELHAGDQILLVRREGLQFYATALAERRLSPQA
jgi:membrane protein implicated in regulation of membrane protease activity